MVPPLPDGATGAYTVVIDTENLHWTAPLVKR